MNDSDLSKLSSNMLDALRNNRASVEETFANFQSLAQVARSANIPFVSPTLSALKTLAGSAEVSESSEASSSSETYVEAFFGSSEEDVDAEG